MRHLVPVVLLIACSTSAQEPLLDVMSDHAHFGPAHFENAQDSAEFMRFRQGLTSLMPDTTDRKGRYRMLWREHQQGGFWVVDRGDGTLLDTRNAKGIHGFLGPHIPFRTADGRFGWMVVHERPCALICRSATYYVEEMERRSTPVPQAPSH